MKSSGRASKLGLKDIELRLVSELMKNCRRSDRELARLLGTSQPTVSRLIKKLEKEGVIREYAMIPDFSKLGYEIMGITAIRIREHEYEKGFDEIRRITTDIEKSNPYAALMAVNVMDTGKNRLFITLYEDYLSFSNAMRTTKSLPFADTDSLESFLVDLNDETNYRILSMSKAAQHLLRKRQRDSS